MPPASPTPTASPTPAPTPTGTVQPPVIPPTPKPLTRRSQQLQAWSTAAQRGRESIQAETNRHRQLAATRGIGAYYGDHSDFSRLPKAAQDAWIQTHLVAGSQAPALHESSCIGWAMMHVAAVYAAAGQGARWQQIKAAVEKGGMKGSVLARELQKDGWKVLYFNPDVEEHQAEVHYQLDAQGQRVAVLDANNHLRYFDEQGSSLRDLDRTGKYYGIPVDGRIVNYNRVNGSGRSDDLTAIEKLRQAPFFFGIGRGGEHTFVGHDGTISELHWDREPDDPNVVGEAKFEDKDPSGNRQFGWHSGAVLVPPGTWPK